MNPHLRRTRANVGPLVLLFCAEHAGLPGGRFFLHQLESHIQSLTSATPGTASRVLRQLRAQGVIAYRVGAGIYALTRIDAAALEDARAQRHLFRDETSGPAR